MLTMSPHGCRLWNDKAASVKLCTKRIWIDNSQRKMSGAGELIEEMREAESKGRSSNHSLLLLTHETSLNSSNHFNNFMKWVSLSLVLHKWRNWFFLRGWLTTRRGLSWNLNLCFLILKWFPWLSLTNSMAYIKPYINFKTLSSNERNTNK